MRRLIFQGLAVAASFALLSASHAQQLFEQNANGLFRFGNTAGRNSSYRWQEGAAVQDAQPAPPSSFAAPTPPGGVDEQIPQPTPMATGEAAKNGAGSTYGNYLNGNCCEDSCCDRSANWVVGVYGLAMSRDYEDDVGLSYDPNDPTGLYESSANWGRGSLTGAEAVIARRGCAGNGFEIRYWGLASDACGCGTGYPPDTALGGLADVNYGGGTVYDVYNAADSHSFYRDNEIHNLEFNLLHCGCSSNCGRTNFEWLVGFRYFYFNEDFSYGAFTDAAVPQELFYDLVTENNLYGVQIGGRCERYLTCRFGLQIGSKIGIFDNHMESTQSINDRVGTFGTIGSGPNAGLNYAFGSSKDDFAMAGELNFGAFYQFFERWRAVGGYRGLAISGVALAPTQIPSNFTDVGAIQRVESNCGLILHGAYFGIEHSF